MEYQIKLNNISYNLLNKTKYTYYTNILILYIL